MKTLPAITLLLLLASCNDSGQNTSPSEDDGFIEIPISPGPPIFIDDDQEDDDPPIVYEDDTRSDCDWGDSGNRNNAPVPEPSTMLILGTGVAATAYARRRRSRHDVR